MILLLSFLKEVFFLPQWSQFSSVAQTCLTLCDPMDHSTPGFPVHHQHPEFTQSHVHRDGDAIQSSHPLLSPSPAFSPSQQQTSITTHNIYPCSKEVTELLWGGNLTFSIYGQRKNNVISKIFLIVKNPT